MVLAVFELSVVAGAARPLADAHPMLFVLLPLSFVAIAVGVGEDATPILLAVFPVSLVAGAARQRVEAHPMPLVGLPLSVVTTAVGEGLHALPMLLAGSE